MFTPQDQIFMQRALALAARGMYTTTPNPRVGALIVKDGQILGEGWHERAGEPHAEVGAVQDAHKKHGAAAVRDSTVYVTLEPCSHHGRTPPCADLLVREGAARVVAAMEDPNPEVAGRGFARLRAAGIDVRCGLMESDARELNIGFVSRMTRGLPWLRLKVAASLDGKTALANGQSQWITSAEARADGHAWRARACAVLTGIGTVLEDDPQLNVREVATPRQPLKVVVDSRLQTPPEARVLDGGNVLIACAIDDAAARGRLEARGAEVLLMPNANGKVELLDLVRELGRRKLNEIHIEAGFKLNGSLLREGCIDELLLYYAPTVLGDSAQGMFNLPTLTQLDAGIKLKLHQASMVGPDLRLLVRTRMEG